MLPLLGELCAGLQIPLTTGPDESAEARGRRVLAELKRRALKAAPRDPDKGAAGDGKRRMNAKAHKCQP